MRMAAFYVEKKMISKGSKMNHKPAYDWEIGVVMRD